jgi:hypothetical protein
MAFNGLCMRKQQKINLMKSIKAKSVKCDCDSLATRIDESGKPECEKCRRLNEMAQIFHDKISMMNPK